MDSRDGEKAANPVVKALMDSAGTAGASIGLDAFIDCALYHPEHGYYTRKRRRVGLSLETDFYTASSLGQVFAQMVIGAIKSRLKGSLASYTFIEMGPESERGLIGALDSHPFKACRVIRHGEPFEVPPRSIVFSNELFDAQPFRRFVRSKGAWLEVAVRIQEQHIEPALVNPLHQLPDLPAKAPEGYTIDWPSGAHDLMEKICQAPWSGLFLAFDYGLEETTVFQQRPEGTGRTYAGHTMGTNLLETPGERDITCHLVWDRMQAILSHWLFQDIHLQRQEAFFMHHASDTLNHLLEGTPPGFSKQKQTLMELLHPDNMGHKFQVLHALRGKI